MADALVEVSAHRLSIEDQNGEVIQLIAEYGQIWRDGCEPSRAQERGHHLDRRTRDDRERW